MVSDDKIIILKRISLFGSWFLISYLPSTMPVLLSGDGLFLCPQNLLSTHYTVFVGCFHADSRSSGRQTSVSQSHSYNIWLGCGEGLGLEWGYCRLQKCTQVNASLWHSLPTGVTMGLDCCLQNCLPSGLAMGGTLLSFSTPAARGHNHWLVKQASRQPWEPVTAFLARL